MIKEKEMIIEKSIMIEMAHRLPNHEGKCRNIHGHSWRISVAVRGPIKKAHTSDDGMVVDFTLLKGALRLLEEVFDHTITLADYDPLVARLDPSSKNGKRYAWGEQFQTEFGLVNVLRDMPPTSENLACVWKDMLSSFLPGITIASVSVKETATSEVIWVAEE